VAFQRRLARDLARPLAIAGLVRRGMEAPTTARALVALARGAPGLIEIIARLTRIGHSSIE
jgi:hypothetical protein